MESMGLKTPKTYENLLERAEKYIQYEEKIVVSRAIYRGNSEKAKDKRENEGPRQSVEWRNQGIKHL